VEQHRNVIIVGSGPAGYTAALYAARAELRPLVFEGAQYGGALMNTTEVENFPGFPDAILGPELMNQLRTQAEKFGAELVPDDVVSVDLAGQPKTVRTLGEEFTADAVILAMGSAYRKLGLPNEEELSGHGVSWCATCDGFFFHGQDIAVVGGSDLPDPVRQHRHRGPPARSPAREPDHGRAGAGQPEDPLGVR
jgi:thioredoxin reductase (NADPH)